MVGSFGRSKCNMVEKVTSIRDANWKLKKLSPFVKMVGSFGRSKCNMVKKVTSIRDANWKLKKLSPFVKMVGKGEGTPYTLKTHRHLKL